MKRMIVVVLLVFLISAVVVPAAAQDDSCGPALFELIDGLAAAAQDAFGQQGDAATAIVLLEDIQALARYSERWVDNWRYHRASDQ